MQVNGSIFSGYLFGSYQFSQTDFYDIKLGVKYGVFKATLTTHYFLSGATYICIDSKSNLSIPRLYGIAVIPLTPLNFMFFFFCFFWIKR